MSLYNEIVENPIADFVGKIPVFVAGDNRRYDVGSLSGRGEVFYNGRVIHSSEEQTLLMGRYSPDDIFEQCGKMVRDMKDVCYLSLEEAGK